MNTSQTRFITLSAMKVTNTEHTAINGNHSKCRMTPFSCALCAFARVLSRRCLWHGIFLAKPQRAQRTIYPRETFAHYAQPSYKPLVTGTIKFGLIKIKKTLLFSMFFLHLYVKKIIFPKIRNYHPIHD